MTAPNAWRRGITEAAFILASILIAFWIDAWWEDRQAMQLEADALSAVLVEVAENLVLLEQVRRSNELQLAAVDRFLRAAPDELRSLSPDTVRVWVGSIMRPSIFDADRAAATVFATIPLSSDHGSAEARRLVSRMQSRLERLERVSGGVGDAYGAVRVKLAEYASRSAPSGRGDVPTMVAQVGPDVLARLRADEEFVAAVIDKAHVQSIYLGALDQAEETLDLLSALSNPR